MKRCAAPTPLADAAGRPAGCSTISPRYSARATAPCCPNDDAGRDDLMVAVHHLACLAHPRGHIAKWLEIWAPWLTLAEHKAIIGD
jgi:hypothetical protein